MPNPDDKLKVPEESEKDLVHSAAKGLLDSLPVLGGVATELFSYVIAPPIEKRKIEWMNEVASRIKMLEEEQTLNFEELKNNEQFIDVVLQATTQVLKSSEKEKIEAFQNAVLNTAIGESPGKTECQIFLNQLDTFTIWHIKILKLIDNPKKWYLNENRPLPSTNSISGLITDAFPRLKGEDELIELIWRDLRNVGFHKTPDIKALMSTDGSFTERTTEFGQKFLKFISSKNEN